MISTLVAGRSGHGGLDVVVEVEDLGLFPGEALAAEVTEAGGGRVDRLVECEVLDDAARSEIEVVFDDLLDETVWDPSRAISFNMKRKWVRNTDGVRDLDENSSAETGADERLGDPSGGVGGRSVDLGVVLAGEGSATVGAPAAVSVDDDLTAGQTGVGLRTANDEAARRLDVVDRVVVEHLGRDDLVDDLFAKNGAHLFICDVISVLDGDDDRVDSNWDDSAADDLVFDRDLRLGIRSDPFFFARFSELGHLDVQLVGEHESERHLLLSFVGGVSEHESLITSADVFVGAVLVDALRDVGRLLLETVLDSACEVVQTFFVRVVSDSLDSITDDFLVVDVGVRVDLAADHDVTCFGESLARDLGAWILLEMGIKDGV